MVEPKLTAKQWDLRFEEDLVKVWASEPDLYAFDPDRGPTYVIDTPPPYPSGTWHQAAATGAVTVATTRPELLAACRTVIVHPDDERWRGAVGTTATVPLFGQAVPVRAHPEAKMDFGSGAAMICSYGDMVDVRLFRELQLEPVKAIDERGRMTSAANAYAGLRIEEAREKILSDLQRT